MNCFAIHIEPASPVMLGRRLNLDSILAYLLLQRYRADGVEETEALRRAHSEIPLAQVNSVFAGSSAMIPKAPVTKRTFYGNLQRHVAAIPNFEDVLQKNEKTRAGGREFEKIEKQYQTFVSVHEEHHLHRPNLPFEHDRGWGIWFVGYGDRSATEDLMADFRYIGAKRTPIRTPEFFDAAPTASPGLLGHDGSVLRPVPCSTDFSPEKYAKGYERFRPPYWRSELAQDPVWCYVPPPNMWPTVANIREVIGVV